MALHRNSIERGEGECRKICCRRELGVLEPPRSHMRAGGTGKLACKFRDKRPTAYMFIYLSTYLIAGACGQDSEPDLPPAC